MIDLLNTKNKFGLIAIAFHWIMALLIISLLILGLYMIRIPVSLQKLKLYGLHKEFGMLVLVLVSLRIGFRLSSITPSLENLPRWESIAARCVHLLFYLLMCALPISGWLITSSAGLPVSFFGWFTLPNIVTANENQLILYENIHAWLAYTLIAVICMHAAAAMKHLFINKDKIMQRMLWP